MVPETALQSGTNSVTVYAVNSSGHALKLTKLNLGWS
jgi:hypothetical protein